MATMTTAARRHAVWGTPLASDPPDEELARPLQQGNLEALTALVMRHHGALLGFLYRLAGGDRALAEDLAQESFLRLLHAAGQYAYPRPFKPWLYAIALNVARDHFKRAETRRMVHPGDDFDPPADDSPEAGLAEEEERRSLVAALRDLPTTQRATLILRYAEGLSLAEIAAVLNVPLGTVKSRLSLGLQRLRARLRAEE